MAVRAFPNFAVDFGSANSFVAVLDALKTATLGSDP